MKGCIAVVQFELFNKWLLEGALNSVTNTIRISLSNKTFTEIKQFVSSQNELLSFLPDLLSSKVKADFIIGNENYSLELKYKTENFILPEIQLKISSAIKPAWSITEISLSSESAYQLAPFIIMKGFKLAYSSTKKPGEPAFTGSIQLVVFDNAFEFEVVIDNNKIKFKYSGEESCYCLFSNKMITSAGFIPDDVYIHFDSLSLEVSKENGISVSGTIGINLASLFKKSINHSIENPIKFDDIKTGMIFLTLFIVKGKCGLKIVNPEIPCLADLGIEDSSIRIDSNEFSIEAVFSSEQFLNFMLKWINNNFNTIGLKSLAGKTPAALNDTTKLWNKGMDNKQFCDHLRKNNLLIRNDSGKINLPEGLDKFLEFDLDTCSIKFKVGWSISHNHLLFEITTCNSGKQPFKLLFPVGENQLLGVELGYFAVSPAVMKLNFQIILFDLSVIGAFNHPKLAGAHNFKNAPVLNLELRDFYLYFFKNIPIPFYFTKIVLQYFDIYGSELQFKLKFTMGVDEFNLGNLYTIIEELKEFVSNTTSFLKDDFLGSNGPEFKYSAYLKLPESLNGITMGDKTEKVINVYKEITKYLNAYKAKNPEQILNLFAFENRIRDKEYKIGPLIFKYSYLLSTPIELEKKSRTTNESTFSILKTVIQKYNEIMQMNYSTYSIKTNSASAMEKKFPGTAAPPIIEEGIIAFIAGEITIPPKTSLITIMAGIGINLTPDNGFATGIMLYAELLSCLKLIIKVKFNVNPAGNFYDTGAGLAGSFENDIKNFAQALSAYFGFKNDKNNEWDLNNFIIGFTGDITLKIFYHDFFTGRVIITDNLLAIGGNINLFPENSLFEIVGSLYGGLKGNAFCLYGLAAVTIFGITLSKAEVTINNKTFWISLTLFGFSLTYELKDNKNIILFTSPLTEIKAKPKSTAASKQALSIITESKYTHLMINPETRDQVLIFDAPCTYDEIRITGKMVMFNPGKICFIPGLEIDVEKIELPMNFIQTINAQIDKFKENIIQFTGNNPFDVSSYIKGKFNFDKLPTRLDNTNIEKLKNHANFVFKENQSSYILKFKDQNKIDAFSKILKNQKNIDIKEINRLFLENSHFYKIINNNNFGEIYINAVKFEPENTFLSCILETSGTEIDIKIDRSLSKPIREQFNNGIADTLINLLTQNIQKTQNIDTKINTILKTNPIFKFNFNSLLNKLKIRK